MEAGTPASILAWKTDKNLDDRFTGIVGIAQGQHPFDPEKGIAPTTYRKNKGRIYGMETGTPPSFGKSLDMNLDDGNIRTRVNTRSNDNGMIRCTSCQQPFKKSGLKIHLAKSKCGARLSAVSNSASRDDSFTRRRTPFIVSQEFHNRSKPNFNRSNSSRQLDMQRKIQPSSSESEEEARFPEEWNQRWSRHAPPSIKQRRVTNWRQANGKRPIRKSREYNSRDKKGKVISENRYIPVITISDDESYNTREKEDPIIKAFQNGQVTVSDEELGAHGDEWEHQEILKKQNLLEIQSQDFGEQDDNSQWDCLDEALQSQMGYPDSKIFEDPDQISQWDLIDAVSQSQKSEPRNFAQGKGAYKDQAPFEDPDEMSQFRTLDEVTPGEFSQDESTENSSLKGAEESQEMKIQDKKLIQSSITKWVRSSNNSREATKLEVPKDKEDCHDKHKKEISINEKNEGNQEDINEWVVIDEENYEDGGTLILTENKVKELQNLVTKGDMNEVIATHPLRIKRGDMNTIYKDGWLNDVVIEGYFTMVSERYPNTAILSSFLYSKLTGDEGFDKGFETARTWIKEDLTETETVLIPVNYNSHWVLIKIVKREEMIYLYDSIIGTRKRSPVPGIFKKFIERYYQEKGKQVTFKIKKLHNIPTQQNSLDCGVFICLYAECIARNAWFNFRYTDIPNMRWKLIWELYNGAIKENVVIRKDGKPLEAKEIKPKKKIQEQTYIQWPPPRSKEWAKLDEDLSQLLQNVGSSPEEKAELHPKLIHSICAERFAKKKEEKKPGPSRRQTKSMVLRKEVEQLEEQLQKAGSRKRPYIHEKLQDKVKLLRITKRAENIRKRRKKLKQNTREFYQQPYTLSRKVLDPEIKGELKSSKEEVEAFLHQAHSDSKRDEPLEVIDGLHEFPEPAHKYDSSLPTKKEFNEILRKAKAKSAPGPNGVPYRVYKNCPGIAHLLFEYLKGLWKKNKIPESWRKANGTLIPKEDGASEIEKFRTISLLNVEGKIFFKLKAEKITKYMLKNQYIDTNVQKGGVPGISGCLEHTAIVSQLIQEAKNNKEDLVDTWLDIRNAYGSIPHRVIKMALERTHLPRDVVSLVESYYADVQIRFTTKKFTTEWQRVEKGIITGCTLSVILFALTMTMIVLSTRKETKGPKAKSGQQQVNARLYMDDIATSTRTTVQTNHLLKELSKFFDWAGLEVRPDKCRTLVIKKGTVVNQPVYYKGEAVKSITEKPIKYLGKIYNKTCHDKEQIGDVCKELVKSLTKIDKEMLPGRCKAWILEHMLLPRLMWPISMYKFPMSKIEDMQAKITSMLKKWLGLPRNLSPNLLYSKSGAVQLPYSSLVEETKVARVRNLATIASSKDETIREANINLDAGKKWKASKEYDNAKSSLRMQEIAGLANRGREGLGLHPRKYYGTSSNKEKRSLVTGKVRESEEDRRKVKSVQLAQQGASLNWNTRKKEITHQEVLSMAENRLKFIVKSVYDLLGTPANKNRWFNTNENKCKVCGHEGTLAHILAGCKVALAQGRYTWRHNKVLKEIAYWVEEQRKLNNKKKEEKPLFIKFVKEGEKGRSEELESKSFLNSARDWELQVDLGKRVKIPEHIMLTRLKPDLILTSNSTKQMIVMELTVPLEERVELSAEMKKSKYEELISESAKSRWKTTIYTVEVGCRGFAANSLSNFLKDLGYRGKEKTNIIKKVELEAEKASNRIWNWSHMKQWGSE